MSLSYVFVLLLMLFIGIAEGLTIGWIFGRRAIQKELDLEMEKNRDLERMVALIEDERKEVIQLFSAERKELMNKIAELSCKLDPYYISEEEENETEKEEEE